MVSRKRGREEMEAETPAVQAEEPSTLQKIRNMWQFASLMQYIFFFGKAVKIEDIEVEEFEQECLSPVHSERLSRIGLALLKFVSSHKGLTLDIFDEYTRRQYQAKAPRRNPFGDEEEPNKFADFDVFTKIKVLHQLSIWTLNNPNPIRERMAETDETEWRMEPLGWDADDREYYVLDDDRLYRRTAPPLPPEPKPKAKPKAKAKRNTRSNKRRRVSRAVPDTTPEETDQEEEEVNGVNGADVTMKEPEDEYGKFGGFTWELIAITLDEYQAFIDSIRKSRDPNEKELRKRVETQVMPVIEQRAEERAREAARRVRELENMQKLATAKRSSRIADKMEKQKAIEEAEAHERRRIAEIEMAHKERERLAKLDEDRASRMMTREQRIREREVKRILQEEQLQKEKDELARLEQNKIDDAERARISERKLKRDMERRQRDLERLQQQEDEWFFDCSVCGMHGQNLDDGEHAIACEKCSVWQHSACHGISKEQAERDDFHFVCMDCKRKMENPIPPLKLRFGSSTSPPSAHRPHKVKIGASVDIPPKPKISKPIKIPNGVNMSSVHHYTPPGYRPPSAGSSAINGVLPRPAASPTKLTSPLVYPGPPPPPPTGPSPNVLPPPHHAYPPYHSPSPPRLPSAGYPNGSHVPNGYPSAPYGGRPYESNGPLNNNPFGFTRTYNPYSQWQTPQPPYQGSRTTHPSPPPQTQTSPPLHQQQPQYYRPPSNSAPAYSPHKPQSSPAPPSSSPSLNSHVGYQTLNAAPTLSPSTAPPILSPPVKKSSPVVATTDIAATIVSPTPPLQQQPPLQQVQSYSSLPQKSSPPQPYSQPQVPAAQAPQPAPNPTPASPQLPTPSSSMIAAPAAPQLPPATPGAASNGQNGSNGSA